MLLGKTSRLVQVCDGEFGINYHTLIENALWRLDINCRLQYCASLFRAWNSLPWLEDNEETLQFLGQVVICPGCPPGYMEASHRLFLLLNVKQGSCDAYKYQFLLSLVRSGSWSERGDGGAQFRLKMLELCLKKFI